MNVDDKTKDADDFDSISIANRTNNNNFNDQTMEDLVKPQLTSPRKLTKPQKY